MTSSRILAEAQSIDDAPCEQMIERNMDSEVDSLGKTIFELSTAHPPITSENEDQLTVEVDANAAEASFDYTDDEGTDASYGYSLELEDVFVA